MRILDHGMMLALRGELQATIDAADEAVMRAAMMAVERVTVDTKDRIREGVAKAGLGKRLANAVRSKQFPEKGMGRNPAGWIYVQPSSVKIFQAFELGETIRSGAGKLLAIPIPGSPAARENYGQRRKGMTTIEDFRARGVEMAFVPSRNGRPAMLVAKAARVSMLKSGRQKVSQAKLSKTGKLGAGTQSVPLFWLVPQATMKKRLNWETEFARASRFFMSLFAVEFEKQLANIEWHREVIANRRAA